MEARVQDGKRTYEVRISSRNAGSSGVAAWDMRSFAGFLLASLYMGICSGMLAALSGSAVGGA